MPAALLSPSGLGRSSKCSLTSAGSAPVAQGLQRRYQQARRQGVAHSAGTDSPQSSERPTGVSPLSAERHAVDPGKYDLSIWHYKPWWCQPPMIVATGLSVIAAAFFLSEESYKVTLLASGPVFAWWYIFLYVMPRQFKSFAIDYMETHDMPEEKKQQ